MRILSTFVLAVLLTPAARAQTAPAAALRLADGTEIQLRMIETVSSANARVGQKVHFQVMSDVRVNGVAVIPRGSSALATITAAQRKRRMGRAGNLALDLESVRLADGETAPLRSTQMAEGEGNGEGVAAGAVVTGLLFWPAAPAFLLMHGHDTTMPEGTRITAYIAGDVDLDPAKFPPPIDYRPTPGVATAAAPVAAAPPAPSAPPAPARRADRSYPGYVSLPKR